MKSKMTGAPAQNIRSPPSRGAWIEILAKNFRKANGTVAPLAGGVD